MDYTNALGPDQCIHVTVADSGVTKKLPLEWCPREQDGLCLGEKQQESALGGVERRSKVKRVKAYRV